MTLCINIFDSIARIAIAMHGSYVIVYSYNSVWLLYACDLNYSKLEDTAILSSSSIMPHVKVTYDLMWHNHARNRAKFSGWFLQLYNSNTIVTLLDSHIMMPVCKRPHLVALLKVICPPSLLHVAIVTNDYLCTCLLMNELFWSVKI